MRALFTALTAGVLISSPALAQFDPIPAEERSPGLTKILRGVAECTEPDEGNAPCGTEYWSMYIHSDGSRYFHVVSDNQRAAEARHAMIWVDPDGETREAFMSNWSEAGVLGSTFVVKGDDSAHVASSDVAFPRAEEGLFIEEVEAHDRLDSIGTGPASADGLHFINYDFDAPGEQPHGIYWVGGSRWDTMVGNIVTSEYTYIGEDEMTLKDGTTWKVDHFRMISGTEVWLTKEDRALLRMNLNFGYPSVWQAVSLDVVTLER